jgi:hypothetical protein
MKRPTPFVDKCQLCGLTIFSHSGHWQHARPTPTGPHDHKAVPSKGRGRK